MKFNLKLAKAGYPVCTTTGQKVRILCYDRKDSEFPIVALVETHEGNEMIMDYTPDGRSIANEEDQYDLRLMQTQKKPDKEYIVAEEYLNGETGDVDDSTILFSTYNEQEAQEYAEKHEIHDHRMTQVAIWEMEESSCRDSWIIKKNFKEN